MQYLSITNEILQGRLFDCFNGKMIRAELTGCKPVGNTNESNAIIGGRVMSFQADFTAAAVESVLMNAQQAFDRLSCRVKRG